MTETPASGPVLVTGASGFVGAYLLKALDYAGYARDQIVALTQKDERAYAPGIRKVVGDLTNRSSISSMLRDVRPEAVIHLAAIAEPAKARAAPDRAWDINFSSVRYLCEEIVAHCPEARLIFAGSAEAYGASFLEAGGPIPEAAPLRPVTTYGATKAAADILIGQMAWQGLKAVRFRAFNHTGPGQAPAYVVSSFAGQVASIEAGLQQPVLKVGNLSSQRDFLDVRDVVRAYVAALSADLEFAAGPVFNIATGRPVAISDILSRLLGMSEIPIEIMQDPERYRAVDVPVASGVSKQASTVLGWSPKIDFDQTLADTLGEARRAIRGGA